MAVALRLQRGGRKKRPFYRIVAADHTKPRNGRFLEVLGTYETLQDPPAVELKEDRVKYWISVGAIPSETVASIIEKQIPGHFSGIVEERRKKLQEKRAKRKARQKKAA